MIIERVTSGFASKPYSCPGTFGRSYLSGLAFREVCCLRKDLPEFVATNLPFNTKEIATVNQ